MSGQPHPFTVEDVEAAWFAYTIHERLEGSDDTPEWCIRRSYPEPPEGTYEILNIPPLIPTLLAKYQHGAEILARAEVVNCRVVGEIASSDYEQLGKIDSPIWTDDQGHVPMKTPRGKNRPKTDEEWMAWGRQRGPQLCYLRALRFCLPTVPE